MGFPTPRVSRAVQRLGMKDSEVRNKPSGEGLIVQRMKRMIKPIQDLYQF